jgi:hypothetical protein
MHARVDAGTDIAMIGAWDQSRGALALGPRGHSPEALELEAAEGHLFFIRTGADGSGAVDVYVDQDIPEGLRANARRADGEFLIRIPSGKLTVAGVEEYGSPGSPAAGGDVAISVQPGDYRLVCYIGHDDDDSPAGPSIRELEQSLLSADDRDYWSRIQSSELRTVLVGYSLLLLFPLLVYPLGWKISVAITAAIFLTYFYFVARGTARKEKTDQRWLRINRMLTEGFLHSQRPTFSLHLRRIDCPTALKGGFIKV